MVWNKGVLVLYLRVDPQQSVSSRVELLLQRDDDDLEALSRLLPDKAGHLHPQRQTGQLYCHIRSYSPYLITIKMSTCFANIGVVQGCINLIQDKERSWTEAD